MTEKIIKKTSAGGILFDKGKYLVIKWLSEGTAELPKGTLEANETPEQACVREVFEETGYNTRIVSPVTVSRFNFTWHDNKQYEKTVHFYLLARVDNLEPTPRRESNEDFENMWLSADKAYQVLTYDNMKDVFKKAIDIINKNNL